MKPSYMVKTWLAGSFQVWYKQNRTKIVCFIGATMQSYWEIDLNQTLAQPDGEPEIDRLPVPGSFTANEDHLSGIDHLAFLSIPVTSALGRNKIVMD